MDTKKRIILKRQQRRQRVFVTSILVTWIIKFDPFCQWEEGLFLSSKKGRLRVTDQSEGAVSDR